MRADSLNDVRTGVKDRTLTLEAMEGKPGMYKVDFKMERPGNFELVPQVAVETYFARVSGHRIAFECGEVPQDAAIA